MKVKQFRDWVNNNLTEDLDDDEFVCMFVDNDFNPLMIPYQFMVDGPVNKAYLYFTKQVDPADVLTEKEAAIQHQAKVLLGHGDESV